MLLKSLLLSSGLLTTAVIHVPTSGMDWDAGTVPLDHANGDKESFRRDSISNALDLELSDVHGVNLTESMS